MNRQKHLCKNDCAGCIAIAFFSYISIRISVQAECGPGWHHQGALVEKQDSMTCKWTRGPLGLGWMKILRWSWKGARARRSFLISFMNLEKCLCVKHEAKWKRDLGSHPIRELHHSWWVHSHILHKWYPLELYKCSVPVEKNDKNFKYLLCWIRKTKVQVHFFLLPLILLIFFKFLLSHFVWQFFLHLSPSIP